MAQTNEPKGDARSSSNMACRPSRRSNVQHSKCARRSAGKLCDEVGISVEVTGAKARETSQTTRNVFMAQVQNS